MPDELLKQFLDTTLEKFTELNNDVRELAQTVYGEDRKNGMKGDIKWIRQKLEGVDFEKIAKYDERIKEVETFKTATEATAKWRWWVIGILSSAFGSIVTAVVLTLILKGG